jgi:hypothetical protein
VNRNGRPRDRGAVDVSVQMLFGTMAVLASLLLVFEAVAFWHARNVFDEAASEGARVAAGVDRSCTDGIASARRFVTAHGGSWASGVVVVCQMVGTDVVVTVSGHTPGVLGAAAGLSTSVSARTPKEA